MITILIRLSSRVCHGNRRPDRFRLKCAMMLLMFPLAQRSAVAQWTLQNSTTVRSLNAVSFVDSNTGWAVGDAGTILHTSNGGENWTQQNSGTVAALRGVSFSDSSHGWAVGNLGTIIRTDDAGRSWKKATYNADSNLFYLQVQSYSPSSAIIPVQRWYGDYMGWVAIIRTADSGVTWDAFFYLDRFQCIYFSSDSVGWVGGLEYIGGPQNFVAATANAGHSWNWALIDSPAGSYSGVTRLFARGNDVWATAAAKLYRSVDAGHSRQVVDTSSSASPGSPQDMVFFGDTGYVCGGRVRCTTDGGHTWISQGLQNIVDLEFVNSRIAWAVGGNGMIAHTTNGGGLTAIPSENRAVESDFRLFQNYPNPFNPKTVISVQWTVNSVVRLAVYDVLGREVAILADGRYPAGKHTFTFDGGSLASGVYFYRLVAGNITAVRKMTLVR